MEENTNQIESMENDDLSFDEVYTTSDDSSDESGEVHETETTETPEQPKDDWRLDIKYNGAVESLTKEQAIEYAQKGRNYDKVMERLNALQNDPTRQVFEEQARRAGLSLEDYAQRLQRFQEESNITRIANDFKQKNPDVSDEVANQYARAEYQNQINLRAQQDAMQRQQMQNVRQQKARDQVEAFLETYPDVDIRTLPQEVVDDINLRGETLLSAYRAFENKRLRSELEAARTNQANKAKATGNLSDNAGSDTDGDPFLQGLLGG